MLILFKKIIVYSFPVISIVGIVTNSLSFLIFTRKRFQNTVFSTYFRFYILFEMLNLILPINKMFEFNFNIYLSLVSDFFCKLRKFFGSCNYAITPWFLVIISLDRFLSIAYPARFLFRKKPIFQILISCFTIGFNLCLYTPFWFYYIKEIRTNLSNQTISSYNCEPPGLWVEFINLSQEFLIPFFLMLLFTLLTIRTVFNSRAASSNNTSKSKDMKFAVSSITINILFLLLSSPYFILLLIKDYSDLFVNISDLFELLEAISYFLYYIYSVIFLFINYYSNSMFKKEFNIVFSFNKNKSNV